MIHKYKTLTRTSFAETENLPHVGVYILAYMGKVVYVGKAEQSVTHRLYGHWLKRDKDALGGWLDKLRDDWINIRLDVLEPPDDVNQSYWLRSAEAALVRRLRPLFNEQLQA